MPITAITRDWGANPSIVRILTTDTLTEVQAAGYITDQQPTIDSLNGGTFQWTSTDYVFLKASDGWGQFTISADFSALTLFAVAGGGGGGGVTPAQIQDQTYTYIGTDTGSADNYVLTASPALAAYADGQAFWFSPANANTGIGSPTVNINGLGNAFMVNYGGQSLQAGDISPSIPCQFIIKFNPFGGFWSAYVQNPWTQGVVSAPAIQQSAFNYIVDTGIDGTAYIANFSNPVPTSLTQAFLVYLYPLNTNTVNNPTLNVNGLGAKTIVADGYNLTPIAQQDIQQGIIAVLQYSGSIDKFILLNPQLTLGAPYNVPSGLYNVIQADTGTTNAVVGDATFYPGSSTWSNGTNVFQKIANTNSGPSTYTFAGLSAAPIQYADGSPLIGGELQAGSYAHMIKNGSVWQILNPFV